MPLKFPTNPFSKLNYIVQEHDIISYAYLYKNLIYPIKFKKDSAFTFNGKTVDGFYASTNSQKQQVFVN